LTRSGPSRVASYQRYLRRRRSRGRTDFRHSAKITSSLPRQLAFACFFSLTVSLTRAPGSGPSIARTRHRSSSDAPPLAAGPKAPMRLPCRLSRYCAHLSRNRQHSFLRTQTVHRTNHWGSDMTLETTSPGSCAPWFCVFALVISSWPAAAQDRPPRGCRPASSSSSWTMSASMRCGFSGYGARQQTAAPRPGHRHHCPRGRQVPDTWRCRSAPEPRSPLRGTLPRSHTTSTPAHVAGSGELTGVAIEVTTPRLLARVGTKSALFGKNSHSGT